MDRAGEAKNNRVVIVALYPTVKESFQIYYDMTEIMGIFIDRFMELEIHDCVKVYEVFCRIGKQFDELDMLYSWCRTIGIARSSEYPEVEKITPKKLEVMDEFIRDKSALAQTIKHKSIEETPTVLEEPAQPNVREEDMNAIKALPPPLQAFTTFSDDDEQVKKEEQIVTQQEGDLLSLGDDAMRSEEHSDKLALALFDHHDHDGGEWEAFNEDAADWETALVESASNLSGQKVTLAAGFDMLLLDGMYKRQAETKAGPGGSASSVALGPTGRPQTLALPAPPTSATTSADPFAASLTVAPPAYVQMSEMEKKQKLLVEEQLMWQQYARDGMQGQLGMAKIQHHNPYNMGGYTHSY
jgi:hypothetical protein